MASPPPPKLPIATTSSPSSLAIPLPEGPLRAATAAVKKAGLKVKRLSLWESFVKEGGQILPSVLASRSVNARSGERYRNHVQALLGWLAENGLQFAHQVEAIADVQIASFMDFLFFEGEEPDRRQHTLNGVKHTWPSLKIMGPKALPLSRQALQGWRRLSPAKSRLPKPWIMIAAACSILITWGESLMSLLTVLAFHCYLRPGVAIDLIWEQLIPPVAGAGAQALWTLTLHPWEGGSASKTAGWDETLHLGDVAAWAWLGPVLSKALSFARRSNKLQGKIASFTLAQWTAKLRSALDVIGCGELFVLYLLRHGGASEDLAENHRSIESVKKRGAWKSDASVARYGKSGRINEQLSRLCPRLRLQVQELASRLPDMLFGAF